MNIACHVKQSSKTIYFGGTLSWRWRSGQRSVRVVPTATTRILRRRFPGTCETVGQVFKFVWRLRWKINFVCMSLSPFVSLQSRFVTYLLTFPRIKIIPDALVQWDKSPHAKTARPLWSIYCTTFTNNYLLELLRSNLFLPYSLTHLSAPTPFSVTKNVFVQPPIHPTTIHTPNTTPIFVFQSQDVK